MLKVIIYENDKKDLQDTKLKIHDLLASMNLEFKIDICPDTQHLFNTIYNYDFLFLDIELDDVNGIELGLEIKRLYRNLHIVITSKFRKYLEKGYTIKADRYFIKPIQKEIFDAEMKNVIEEYYENELGFYDESIIERKVFFHEIMYVDFMGKNSYLNLNSGKRLKTSYPLHYWNDKLSGLSFAQSYKSIFINCSYVDYIDKNDVVLMNHEKLPISRHYKSLFKKKWIESIQKKI